MALIKEIETDRGTASFWVVSLLQLDNFSKMGYIRLYGFQSKTHADKENPKPVHTIELTVNPELYKQYFDPTQLAKSGRNPHQQAYLMIKNSQVDDAGNVIYFGDAVDEIGGK